MLLNFQLRYFSISGSTRLASTRLLSTVIKMNNQDRKEVSSVLDYWFGLPEDAPIHAIPSDEKRQLWFKGSPEIDQEIKSRFGPLLERAAAGQLEPWLAEDQSALAGIIVMDQFSRNVYRGTPRAFALDHEAVRWSKLLVSMGRERRLRISERHFVYMPFMHSENMQDQEECVRLFKELAKECEAVPELEKTIKMQIHYSQAHRDVISRWGRFPHRNAAVGRESTLEEIQGLQNGTISKW